MKKTKLCAALLVALIIASCGASKKTTTSSVAATPSSTTATTPVTEPAGPFIFAASKPGLQTPGNEELSAIQLSYPEVTLEKLKLGHTIYTEGACINCHGAKNIYKYETAEWKGIVDNMAKEARISDADKDAVYKYVLAIKATQPK